MAVSFNLQDFIVRARVLKLYRQALRISNRAPVHARDELRRRFSKNCTDKQRVCFLLSEGKERVKQLDEMLDMQGH